jgi:hypothetical protein
MNGWIALAIYVSIDLTLTIGLFIYRNNLKKKRVQKIIQALDFPEWVNNDIDDKFNSIVGRLNHPTYKQK